MVAPSIRELGAAPLSTWDVGHSGNGGGFSGIFYSTKADGSAPSLATLATEATPIAIGRGAAAAAIMAGHSVAVEAVVAEAWQTEALGPDR